MQPIAKNTSGSEFSIKNRIFFGTFWTLGGYGASQLLRLGGNLILTRLLVPEMFGLMALVSVFLVGLALFSDLGIGSSIIQNKRGDDPEFYNTAWTIQVLRGVIIWLCGLILALPVSRFYGEPMLLLLLPIVSLNCIFSGFNSTSIYLLNRRIELGKLTAMELGTQAVSLLVMMAIAFYERTIWALVIGSLVGSSMKMIWSHSLGGSHRNRFAWDQTSTREIVSFGKWIFISTAMTFLASQADRLILAKLFTLSFLGVYSIAAMLSEAPKQVVMQLSAKVIFPVISLYSHLPRRDLQQKILRKRVWLLSALGGLVAILACFGDMLVTTLYDNRYSQAAWMLPLLAMGIWPLLLYATIGPCLFAIGKPKYVAVGNFAKFLFMLLAIPLSFSYFGVLGAVVVVAFNDLPAYLFITYGLHKEGISGVGQDILATLILCIALLVIFWLRHSLGFGFPLSTLNSVHLGR